MIQKVQWSHEQRKQMSNCTDLFKLVEMHKDGSPGITSSLRSTHAQQIIIINFHSQVFSSCLCICPCLFFSFANRCPDSYSHPRACALFAHPSSLSSLHRTAALCWDWSYTSPINLHRGHVHDQMAMSLVECECAQAYMYMFYCIINSFPIWPCCTMLFFLTPPPLSVW